MAANSISASTVAPRAPNARVLACTASVLALAGALALVAVLPYVATLFPDQLARLRVPLPVFVLAQFVQALLLLGLLAWCGLRLGRPLGLGAPIVQAIACREPVAVWSVRSLGRAALAGAAAGAVLLLLDAALAPYTPAAASASPAPADIAVWKRLLASFYGGITEELLCRLFLMTLIVWLCRKLAGRTAAPATAAMAWIGIVGAAVLFGLGHLPAAAGVWPLTPLVVARVLVLNCLAGIVFGWLYWRRGLEHAMLAHFSADIVLHVIGMPAAGGA